MAASGGRSRPPTSGRAPGSRSWTATGRRRRRPAAAGRDARAFVADVSSAEDVRAMVSATTDAFGRLDVLVNSAAI